MPYRIKATFVLGFYQGRNPQGELEEYPTPARLYAALTSGAYSLERLEGNTGDELVEADQRVFEWLEENPPDAVLLPGALKADSSTIVYRNRDGIKKKTDDGKKAVKASSRTFLSGPICWYWIGAPSDSICNRLKDITSEVPYLGEAVSSVVIEASLVETIPEDALYRCEPSFDAMVLPVALPGRQRVLQGQYEVNMKSVSKRSESAPKANEGEQQLAYPHECLGSAYYKSPKAQELRANPHAPWTHGYVLQIQGKSSVQLDQEDYVAWCLCLHRAIVRQFGDDLPLIMQRMSPDGRSLANGVAIQIVTESMPMSDACAIDGAALVVMIPAGAPYEEEAQVLRALSRVDHLYSRDLGKVGVVLTGEQVDLAHFWRPVPTGCHRVFQPTPLFIPESRPPSRKKPDGSRWTFDDDARLAIGHVWRDLLSLSPEGSGDARRISLSEQVGKAGVRVFGGRVVPTNNIRKYVHKTPKGSMLVGGQALIDLTAIGCDECLTAIGQTRHLGGGLLVPIDMPSDMFAPVEGGDA